MPWCAQRKGPSGGCAGAGTHLHRAASRKGTPVDLAPSPCLSPLPGRHWPAFLLIRRWQAKPCQNKESEPRRQRRTALSEVDPVGQQEAIRLPTRRREQRPSLPLLKRKRTGRGTRRAPCRSYGEIQIGFASRRPPSSAMARGRFFCLQCPFPFVCSLCTKQAEQGSKTLCVFNAMPFA